MEKKLEQRTIRCRYGEEDRYLKDISSFGWSLSSKTLINRFGNPLPLDAHIDESEKREKCFIDLGLIREIETDKIMELNALQNEYDALSPVPGGFGKGRIVGMVFTMLGIFFFFALSYTFFGTGNPEATATGFVFLVLGLLFIGGIVALIVSGVGRVKKISAKNKARLARRNELKQKAEEILQQ